MGTTREIREQISELKNQKTKAKQNKAKTFHITHKQERKLVSEKGE